MMVEQARGVWGLAVAYEVIEWVDHHGSTSNSQWTAKEIGASCKEPYIFETVGVVAFENESYVTLALDRHRPEGGEDTFRGFTCILKAQIKSRRVLR